MIDVTVKQHVGGVGNRPMKKSSAKTRRKHDAINLPKNLLFSDNEGEDQLSSEEENDQYTQNDRNFEGTRQNMTEDGLEDGLTCSYLNLVIDDKSCMIEALRKLKAVVNKYKEDCSRVQFKDKELKARSPYRNKLDEHKKNKHYDGSTNREAQKKSLAVTSPHFSGGQVAVQNLMPVDRPDLARSLPKDNELETEELYELVNAIQDVTFMSSFKKLTEDEVENVFNMFLSEPESQIHSTYSVSVENQRTDVTHSRQLTVTLPLNVEQYDSSYETGSPSSTMLTSPGSSSALFSPPHTSISSESDQELEAHRVQPATTLSLVRCVNIKPESCLVMKPLGQVVPMVKKSATDRLAEFQNSTSFCIQHFSIQLVRVIMSAKGQAGSENVQEFSKSLINTMKIKLGNGAREGDIWQLSILAHVQFLLARVAEYKYAFLVRDELNHSLLYIAAIEQYKKPLIARYIAESMYKLGFNPLEVDEKGDTILHLLAEQGDSHVHVLSELLMACSPNSVHVVNKVQQTALHAAVRSSKPHLTTVLTLLKMNASPLQQDVRGRSALRYHLEQLEQQIPRRPEDVEVLRKMLQSLVSLNNYTLLALRLLTDDPSIPADLRGIILEEVSKYGIKDLRLKRIDKLTMSASCN